MKIETVIDDRETVFPCWQDLPRNRNRLAKGKPRGLITCSCKLIHEFKRKPGLGNAFFVAYRILHDKTSQLDQEPRYGLRLNAFNNQTCSNARKSA